MPARSAPIELATASADAEVTIFATGSEVEIALAACAALEKRGRATRVVSVPCFELFEAQSDDYRAAIIGDAPVKVAIEAGVRQGWDAIIGADGIFIGMSGFGASGRIEDLLSPFRHHRRGGGGCGRGKAGREVAARRARRRGSPPPAERLLC